MKKFDFTDIFIETEDAIETKVPISIGGQSIAPGIKLQKGETVVGIDVSNFVGRVFHGSISNGVLIIDGYETTLAEQEEATAEMLKEMKGMTDEEIQEEVEETRQIIAEAGKYIEMLQEVCEHKTHSIENYSWRPGAMYMAKICDVCGKNLGPIESHDWTKPENLIDHGDVDEH